MERSMNMRLAGAWGLIRCFLTAVFVLVVGSIATPTVAADAKDDHLTRLQKRNAECAETVPRRILRLQGTDHLWVQGPGYFQTRVGDGSCAYAFTYHWAGDTRAL